MKKSRLLVYSLLALSFPAFAMIESAKSGSGSQSTKPQSSSSKSLTSQNPPKPLYLNSVILSIIDACKKYLNTKPDGCSGNPDQLISLTLELENEDENKIFPYPAELKPAGIQFFASLYFAEDSNPEDPAFEEINRFAKKVSFSILKKHRKRKT